jgi:hypothetical protein
MRPGLPAVLRRENLRQPAGMTIYRSIASGRLMRDTGEYYRFCLRHLERAIGFRFRRTLKNCPGSSFKFERKRG